MLQFIFEFVTYLMAVYGFYCLFCYLAGHISDRTCKRQQHPARWRPVLLIRDAEEVAEGIIRGICFRNVFQKPLPGKKLLVIDMGSRDKTCEIVKRLSEECGFVEFLEYDDRLKAFESFSGQEI